MSNFLSKEGFVSRSASHAGSWYDDRESVLRSQLENWLTNTGQTTSNPNLKAIICPHAGYRFSGPTSAYGYHQIDPNTKNRIFVIGPSHHVYSERMNITGANVLETPLGNLAVDAEVRQNLLSSGLFDVMNSSVDSEEHSLEMQFPFIAHMMREKACTLVPIMSGKLNSRTVAQYAEILLPYFLDPENLFVISSDFCHWGQRFRYTPYDESKGSIDRYINWLDHEAIKLIESLVNSHSLFSPLTTINSTSLLQDHEGFRKYIKETKNTICGQDPIKVLLELIRLSDKAYHSRCLNYSQSSAAKNMQDSSVSYASLAVEEVH